jgi:hypothetical protein
MGRKWEYALLRFTRDPGNDVMSFHGWLFTPGADDWKQLNDEKLSHTKEVNRLGAEGWELIGPPISQDSVFTYKAANGTWHDRAYWVERDFWFKREVKA